MADPIAPDLSRALLPAGFHDVLPPDAAREAAAVERLVRFLGRHGYDRVKPPLVEFEDSLLSGAGAATAGETFRLMDPVSHRMLAVRADMTGQIARIARDRLVNAPRPLRLAYAGQILRVTGSQLRPERQFTQVGAELIGAAAPDADAEVAVMAAEALADLGVSGLCLDLNAPTLVSAVLAALPPEPGAAKGLRRALDRKDSARVRALGGTAAPVLDALLAASGPAESALRDGRAIALPDAAAADRDRLLTVVALVRAALPDLTVTVDFVEHRGFEYHTGIGFTLFARNVRGELGRGGRYIAGAENGDADEGEPATGVTLFMDSVLRAAPTDAPSPRLFLPHGTDRATAARLRAEGWTTLAGLEPAADAAAEARRLGCSHWWQDGAAAPVT